MSDQDRIIRITDALDQEEPWARPVRRLNTADDVEAEALRNAIGELRDAYASVEPPFCFEPGSATRADAADRPVRSGRLRQGAIPVAAAAIIALAVFVPRSLEPNRTAEPDAPVVAAPYVPAPAPAPDVAPPDAAFLVRVPAPLMPLAWVTRSGTYGRRDAARRLERGSYHAAIGLTTSKAARFAPSARSTKGASYVTKAPKMILEIRRDRDVHDANDRSGRGEPVGRSVVSESALG